MFSNEPTAADFAWSDAQSALEKNKKLEKRVEDLERIVGFLYEEFTVRRTGRQLAEIGGAKYVTGK